MTRFLYSGPMQSIELRVPDAEAGDGATRLLPVTCVPGQPVELPDGHPVTIALGAAGFLAPAPAEIVETPAEPVTAELVEAAEEIPAATPARPRPSRTVTQTPQE